MCRPLCFEFEVRELLEGLVSSHVGTVMSTTSRS